MINGELGQTGAGLTVEQIRDNPDLSNILGMFVLEYLCSTVYADQSLCSDQLIIDHSLPVWERLHGFWRTLPNFNPHAVSSEPGQDLEGKGRELMFAPCGNGNAGEEEEPENAPDDKIKDASLKDLVEGAAGLKDVNINIGLEDAPNKVRDSC